ncbi:MAG: RsmB/NOP family class I SAM-dependent RNA methyltransferase [Lachnospiraceae bacterium]|nr:RsmB/NOP family class I SAM-dependent RNA methyltransferase [Lachnospiraceae bacterium]
MKLPQEFEKRMQDMLGEAYPAFLHSYEENKYQALRVNPWKAETQELLEKSSFHLKSVPWELNGYYYESDDQPGKHPWHEAGVYYIQEPSAMAPAAYLEAKPGEKILDLCAAPGGKTTQIASYMKGEGILVCNEIHPARAKILAENVERMGIPNAMVTNESPQKLAEIFEEYFDRILVDAPCSGEGMFRKNEEACEEWSLENVRICAERQDEILDCAHTMLRPGGRIVYSTCTFAPAENEGSMARFLIRHPEYELLEIPLYQGMERGVPAWSYTHGNEGNGISAEAVEAMHIERTIRLWPHKLQGEGHYLAVLQKKGEVPQGYEGFLAYGKECGTQPDMTLRGNGAKNKKADRNENKKSFGNKNSQGNKKSQGNKAIEGIRLYLEFEQDTLKKSVLDREHGGFLTFGDQLYLIPKGMPAVQGLKVLRPGLHLGTIKKERFEPSHALALYLHEEEVKRVMLLTKNEPQAQAFINGQTMNYDGEKGWHLIMVDGYSLGWGKLAGQVMKNHYPKGLRK